VQYTSTNRDVTIYRLQHALRICVSNEQRRHLNFKQLTVVDRQKLT